MGRWNGRWNGKVEWEGGVDSFPALRESVSNEHFQFKIRLVHDVFMAFNFCNHNPAHTCNPSTLIVDLLKQAGWKK